MYCDTLCDWLPPEIGQHYDVAAVHSTTVLTPICNASSHAPDSDWERCRSPTPQNTETWVDCLSASASASATACLVLWYHMTRETSLFMSEVPRSYSPTPTNMPNLCATGMGFTTNAFESTATPRCGKCSRMFSTTCRSRLWWTIRCATCACHFANFGICPTSWVHSFSKGLAVTFYEGHNLRT